ncbi:hypothetical protein [Actinacidiphila glaucinigra]|uniref:hypothetical protein n=1 Tax=Actinacidiphila glaucinigra TaxID=235986 RepID=UPI0035D5C00B
MEMDTGHPKAMTEAVRSVWLVEPLEGVGPLRFGMLTSEVRAALPTAFELSSFQADPHYPWICGLQFGFSPATPAVYAYFDSDGLLYCVTIDAAHGPQVTLHGLELTGHDPDALEEQLLELPWSADHVSYGPRGNPGINALGLVMRAQETDRGLRTRPVLVARGWADRCVDDYEGPIPECEWLGREWPQLGRSEHLCGVGDEPTWPHGWRPPF